MLPDLCNANFLATFPILPVVHSPQDAGIIYFKFITPPPPSKLKLSWHTLLFDEIT